MTKNTMRIILDVVPELHAFLNELYRRYTAERMNGMTFAAFCKDLLSEAAKSKLSPEDQAQVLKSLRSATAVMTQEERERLVAKATPKFIEAETARIEKESLEKAAAFDEKLDQYMEDLKARNYSLKPLVLKAAPVDEEK